MALTVELEKKLGDFRLEVSFTAGEGETLALLGASGSGKSVTLRCIAGVERPDRGRVVLDGMTLFDSAAHINLPPQKRRVGYLFQNYALFPHMTAEENIAVCLRRLPKALRQARVMELLNLLGLSGTEHLLPGQLSGGQQQRAALARILASDPRAVLLDEPFAALDLSLRWTLEQSLRTVLAGFGGPVVWVSHDLGEVCRNCQRVCLLESGRSGSVCRMTDLLERPETVGAARLAGFRNLLSVQPGPAPETVFLPDWGLVLHTVTPWQEDTTTLGIRWVELAEGHDENAFFCRALEAVQDLNGMLVPLLPETGSPPPIWMELQKEVWQALPEKRRLYVRVRPEDLFLLR